MPVTSLSKSTAVSVGVSLLLAVHARPDDTCPGAPPILIPDAPGLWGGSAVAADGDVAVFGTPFAVDSRRRFHIPI